MARVSAIGPNSSWPGPEDFHVPLPRLQSMRAAISPSAAEGQGVLRAVVRRDDGVVAALKPHQLPRCSRPGVD